MNINSARIDYYDFLAEVGRNENDVRCASENTNDVVIIDTDSVYLDNSKIEGTGLFSSVDIERGAVVIAALMSGKRTQAGRYNNHSDKPNASMQFIWAPTHVF